MTKLPMIIALALSMAANSASAQWYQGPSGGSGGSPFDFWQDSGHAMDVAGVGVIDDGTIRCIFMSYRKTPTTNLSTTYRHGTCRDERLNFQNSCSMPFAPDEYLLGVEGTYKDHITSLRLFTNKGTSRSCKENPRDRTVWGTKGPHSFGYTAPSGQMIVALIGRSGESVDSIGVMYAPCPRATKRCR